MAFRELSLGGLSQRLGPWLDRAVPLGFGLALAVLTPWRTAFRFGMDEGYELMKALLVSQGHPLYGAFWNDQPPLHTELLAGLFGVFGPSAGVGRLLSLGFAMLLVGALYGLARRGSNRLAGLAAVGLLVSASEFLSLSVSVMLELPAFALGLASVWAWVKGRESGRRRWFAFSGALFGAALQVKFTAALLLPALAADFLLGVAGKITKRRERVNAPPPDVGGYRVASEVTRGTEEAASGCSDAPPPDVGSYGENPPPHVGGYPAASEVTRGTEEAASGCSDAPPPDAGGYGIWVAGAAAVFGLVMLLWYQPGTWAVFGASHFSAGTRAGATLREVVFHPMALEEDLALLAPAAVGLGLLGWKRRRELLFPAVLLGTVAAVHWFHRPFWPYYRLHFGIPLAWLGGVGLVEGFRGLWRVFPPATWPGRIKWGGAWVAWSLAVSTALTLAPEKTGWELRRLRWAPLAREQARVIQLRRYAPRTRWIFTENRLSAFWAGLPIPPELAVIPSKRRWSGQLTPAQVVACLERYRPELVLLPAESVERFDLADYLRTHYRAMEDLPDGYWRRPEPRPAEP